MIVNADQVLLFIFCKNAIGGSFSDLSDDWSSKAIPDLYGFVPYTWTINLIIKQFELVTLCNEYNWMDTSSHNQENGLFNFHHWYLFMILNSLSRIEISIISAYVPCNEKQT